MWNNFRICFIFISHGDYPEKRKKGSLGNLILHLFIHSTRDYMSNAFHAVVEFAEVYVERSRMVERQVRAIYG